MRPTSTNGQRQLESYSSNSPPQALNSQKGVSSQAIKQKKPKSKLYINILAVILIVKLKKSMKRRRHREKIL